MIIIHVENDSFNQIGALPLEEGVGANHSPKGGVGDQRDQKSTEEKKESDSQSLFSLSEEGFKYCDTMICIEMKLWINKRNAESTGKTILHHRKVVGALRISPAATKSTVDRRHQVPEQRDRSSQLAHTNLE